MEHKGFLPLLVLLLGFSSVLCSVAVPTSRSLKSLKDALPVQDLLAQGEMDTRTDGELSDVEGVSMVGRMVMEMDYPGTGPNNHHDPSTPTPARS